MSKATSNSAASAARSGHGRSKVTSRGAGVIDRHVGGRMRERRLALGMSQTDLADELQLTFQQVQKYEKGTNRIGAGRLLIAAQVLKTSVAFFYQGAPGMKDSGDDGAAPDVANVIARARDGHALATAFIASGTEGEEEDHAVVRFSIDTFTDFVTQPEDKSIGPATVRVMGERGGTA